jgi:hypothetical protein
MKIKIFFFLFATSFINAQESDIKVTPEGISTLVVPAEGLTAIQEYDKSKMLILKMFDNVIKVDEIGKILRFDGYKVFKEGFSSGGLYKYTCQLEFKDERYKISFYDVYLTKGHVTYSDLFNKEGEIRRYDYYKNIHSNFVLMLNEINALIKNSILKKKEEDKW